MTVWEATRMMGWRSKAVVGVGLLAVILVAAVPVAFVAGVILMLLGHVVGGFALFGASVVAAVAAVVTASKIGVRHVRALITRQRDTVARQWGGLGGQADGFGQEPSFGQDARSGKDQDHRVVQLDRNDYHFD
ncbi:MAG TPA: hypothetical protein VGG75_40610 [Trebonia sp.]|jgi:hypothetical protein